MVAKQRQRAGLCSLICIAFIHSLYYRVQAWMNVRISTSSVQNQGHSSNMQSKPMTCHWIFEREQNYINFVSCCKCVLLYLLTLTFSAFGRPFRPTHFSIPGVGIWGPASAWKPKQAWFIPFVDKCVGGR